MEYRQQQIVDEFEALAGWDERYERLIQIGSTLPALPAEKKSDAFKVKGCQSQVWLHAELDAEGLVHFAADSDALIVKGLAALLLRVYSGRTPTEILAAQPEFIEAIGMRSHLSATRANGLASMLKQIRLYALAFQMSAPAAS